MSVKFNRDKDIEPVISVCIVTDVSGWTANPVVTIPDSYLHPRQCYQALIHMGLDAFVTHSAIKQLAHWLSATEVKSDTVTYGKPYAMIEQDFGLKITYQNFRDLNIDGPRH